MRIDALAGRGGAITLATTHGPKVARAFWCPTMARHSERDSQPRLRARLLDEEERMGHWTLTRAPHRGENHGGELRLLPLIAARRSRLSALMAIAMDDPLLEGLNPRSGRQYAHPRTTALPGRSWLRKDDCAHTALGAAD